MVYAHVPAKFGGDRSSSVGGVAEQTHKHTKTHKQTHKLNSNFSMILALAAILDFGRHLGKSVILIEGISISDNSSR